MPHSHHSHSGQFCKHAVGALETVVQQAIAQKFEVFGLTEHVPRYREADLYPEERELVSPTQLHEQFISFLREAERLKVHYSPQISLLIGLETEYITSRDLDELEQILKHNSIEYIVGSIHHVNGIPIDFDEPTYQQALSSFAQDDDDIVEDFGHHHHHHHLEKFFLAYFDAQFELLQRFQPEIIGHFDLCRLYTPSIRFTDYPTVWERIERNIKFAVSYGALFEVNTAAFRKGWNTAYPGQDVSELIISHGGRFALSDDSHGPHAVGLNYDRLFHYLQLLDVTEIWYLESSDKPNRSGRRVHPVKLENWSTHPFWSSLVYILAANHHK